MTRMEVIIRDCINDCSLCMLENLFSLGSGITESGKIGVRLSIFRSGGGVGGGCGGAGSGGDGG